MTSRQWRVVAAIVTVIVVADQLTKSWALEALGDGSTVDLFWTLRFNLAFNTGMAFSAGSNMGPVIGIVSMGVLLALVISLRTATAPLRRVATALVIAGAMGNLIDRSFRGDRWFRGAVVDFIDFQWWPIFNIADAAIVVGAVMLVIALSRTAKVES